MSEEQDDSVYAIEVSPENALSVVSALMDYMYQERGIKGIEDVLDTVVDLAASYAQVDMNTMSDEIKNRMN